MIQLKEFFTRNGVTDSFYRKFVAVSVGNVMEWYDFAVFGCFADVIADQFFPSVGNSNIGLLKSFAVFGAAFYARPAGVRMSYMTVSCIHVLIVLRLHF
jgi:hypothetical protein